jgi:hypothetical protein
MQAIHSACALILATVVSLGLVRPACARQEGMPVLKQIIPQGTWPGINKAIAIRGDWMAMSCSGAFEGDGNRIEIWKKTNGVWALRQSIVPPADCAWGGFGNRLAMRGSVLVVRATDIPTTAARIFTYEDGAQWAPSGELKASASSGSGFGTSFDIGDGFIAVGDTTATSPGDRLGAVTVFVPAAGGWTERQGQHRWIAVDRHDIGIALQRILQQTLGPGGDFFSSECGHGVPRRNVCRRA